MALVAKDTNAGIYIHDHEAEELSMESYFLLNMIFNHDCLDSRVPIPPVVFSYANNRNTFLVTYRGIFFAGYDHSEFIGSTAYNLIVETAGPIWHISESGNSFIDYESLAGPDYFEFFSYCVWRQ